MRAARRSLVATLFLATAAIAGSTVPFLVPADASAKAFIDEVDEADAPASRAMAHRSHDNGHGVQCTIVRLGATATVGDNVSGARAAVVPTIPAELRRQAASLLRSLTSNCTTSPLLPGQTFHYKFCFGASARQTGDGGDFSLGNFVGPSFEQLSQPYWPADTHIDQQKFTGGDACGAILRSTTVHLRCGASFRVVAASEPATCVYEMTATHPDLCALPASVFPRAASSVGGGAGAAKAQAIIDALPSRLRGVASRLSSAPAGASGEDGGAGAGKDVITTRDAAGVGGRSIGVDDRYRISKLWTGLNDGGNDGQATWALELYHTLAKSTGTGKDGVTTASSKKASADVGGASDHSLTVTCTAYSTDDLRKNGGTVDATVGTGKDSSPSSSSRSLGPFALLLSSNTPASPSASASGGYAQPEVLRAAARGPNRYDIPVFTHSSIEGAQDPALPGLHALSASVLTGAACDRRLEDSTGGSNDLESAISAACAAITRAGRSGSDGSGGTGIGSHWLGALVYTGTGNEDASDSKDNSSSGNGSGGEEQSGASSGSNKDKGKGKGNSGKESVLSPEAAARLSSLSAMRQMEYASLTVRLAPQPE